MHQILISHLLIFLGGGRKSFELPCTSIDIRDILDYCFSVQVHVRPFQVHEKSSFSNHLICIFLVL